MTTISGCVTMGLVAAMAMACSAAPEGDLGTTRAASVPACQTEPYACENAPFATGAWIGDTGPFAALVLSDQLCSDSGYCFTGDLADGTRLDGDYFHRPELVRFHWPDTGLLFQGFSVQNDVLTLYKGPEGRILPVATLHRAASYCDEPADCALQSPAQVACDTPVTECRRHACEAVCPRTIGVTPWRPAVQMQDAKLR